MNLEDATKLLIELFRNPDHGRYAKYGYDFYLPSLLKTYFLKQTNSDSQAEAKFREEIPNFYAAAWELCRRGIIRPGVNEYGAQSTEYENGYSLTPFGEVWLEESENDDFVPTEPGRFAEMLEPYKEKFGPGFHQRAQEAIRCYNAHAYLSCCVMCGAATESIILAAAIEKKDEEEVLNTYNRAQGRTAIEHLLIGQKNDYIKREYGGYTSLLKYWRDASAHGKKSDISENEAYTALALLLRFSFFMNENWEELTN